MNKQLIITSIIIIDIIQQPKKMIPYEHSQRNQYNLGIVKLLLCGLVFIDLTAFFFLSFMNICFDTLVSDPPVWLLTILFLIMGLDLVALLHYQRRVTVKFVLNLVIMILLILSWAINVNWIIFLSAAIVLRFPEIVQYNEIIQDKLRAYGGLFKVYTLIKIFYMFYLVGHVLGCIFYAIDNILIKMQYYGPIEQNPGMYYQGSMLCYSPIYSLSQIDRYLYCMYYINSLLATVAYGDIIPKNPFENAYVCILLVLSTVSISFIIEQLLIVLKDNWDTVYQILKKLKYFDSMLEKSTGVTKGTRLKLVNFIYHSMLHTANNNPNIARLTPALQFRIMGESIGMKANKTSKQKSFKQELVDIYTLPNFLVQYVLLKLQLTYYPGKYMIVDNENAFEESSVFVTSRGELKIGYGNDFLMRKYIRSRNRLFCWREFILNNKSIHPQFKIETKGLCQLYTFGAESLKLMIQEQRISRTSDDSFSKMLELYHIARDKQLLLIYEESIDHFYTTQSMNLIALDSNDPDQAEEADLVSKHIVRCWGCGNRTHFPNNCPNLHYKVSVKKCLANVKRLVVGTRLFERSKIQSKKVKPTYKKEGKHSKTKQFFINYIHRKHEQLRNLDDLFHSARPKIFEKYQKYQYFYPEYNFSCNSTSDS